MSAQGPRAAGVGAPPRARRRARQPPPRSAPRSIVIAVPGDAAAARSALEARSRERGGGRRIKVAAVPVALPRGRGERADHVPRRRPAAAHRGPAAAVRARPPAAPDARPEPRDARPRRADRPPRADVVPRRSAPATTRAPRWSPWPARSRLRGVHEIACGAPLRLGARHGGRRRVEPLRAVLVGGCHGVWIAGRRDRHGHARRRAAGPSRRQPRRRGHRRPRPVGMPRAGARPRDRLARRAERRPVRPVQQRAARDRRAPRPRWRAGERSRARTSSSSAGAPTCPGAAPATCPTAPCASCAAACGVFAQELAAHERRPLPRLPPPAHAGAAARPHACRRMNAHLRVDPIACAGHGLCAELFPEWIELDDWGYPIIDRGPIPDQLLAHARRAVDGVPEARAHAPGRRLTPRAAEAVARSGSARRRAPAGRRCPPGRARARGAARCRCRPTARPRARRCGRGPPSGHAGAAVAHRDPGDAAVGGHADAHRTAAMPERVVEQHVEDLARPCRATRARARSCRRPPRARGARGRTPAASAPRGRAPRSPR